MHDTKMKRKVKTIVKGISRKIFQRIALESGPTVHLGGGPMTEGALGDGTHPRP